MPDAKPKCPDCGTAELKDGRQLCQSCAALIVIRAREGLTRYEPDREAV